MNAVPITALAVDLLLGEPPPALHPTVWMGRFIDAARARRRSTTAGASLLEGGAVLVGGVLVAAAAGGALARIVAGSRRSGAGASGSIVVLGRWPGAGAGAGAGTGVRPPGRCSRGTTSRPNAFVRSLAAGAALKPTLSLRALLTAGADVERALRRDDLPEARRLLGWHLVSRDTAELSATEVAGAAIESLAENLADGVVAPLLAHAAGGLPAAYAHRFVNTADAMLGYRTPELEWFGKAAARADDVLAWVPARVAAALVAACAGVGAGDAAGAVRGAFRDAGATASPNAGLPMAAMAGALGVRLTKRGAYVLNAAGCEPVADDLARARRIVLAAGVLAAVLASALPRRTRPLPLRATTTRAAARRWR